MHLILGLLWVLGMKNFKILHIMPCTKPYSGIGASCAFKICFQTILIHGMYLYVFKLFLIHGMYLKLSVRSFKTQELQLGLRKLIFDKFN